MMSIADPNLVDFELDIYWVVVAGHDPEAWFNKYPNRFKLVHVKDKKGDESVVLGTGTINFPQILKEGHKKGVDYFVEVSGNATIVNKDYLPGQSRDDKKVLVKMNMVNIEYTEPHTRKPKSKIETLVDNCYNWFINTISFPHHSDTILKKLGRIN